VVPGLSYTIEEEEEKARVANTNVDKLAVVRRAWRKADENRSFMVSEMQVSERSER